MKKMREARQDKRELMGPRLMAPRLEMLERPKTKSLQAAKEARKMMLRVELPREPPPRQPEGLPKRLQGQAIRRELQREEQAIRRELQREGRAIRRELRRVNLPRADEFFFVFWGRSFVELK